MYRYVLMTVNQLLTSYLLFTFIDGEKHIPAGTSTAIVNETNQKKNGRCPILTRMPGKNEEHANDRKPSMSTGNTLLSPNIISSDSECSSSVFLS